jgi:hypothetical protein
MIAQHPTPVFLLSLLMIAPRRRCGVPKIRVPHANWEFLRSADRIWSSSTRTHSLLQGGLESDAREWEGAPDYGVWGVKTQFASR